MMAVLKTPQINRSTGKLAFGDIQTKNLEINEPLNGMLIEQHFLKDFVSLSNCALKWKAIQYIMNTYLICLVSFHF